MNMIAIGTNRSLSVHDEEAKVVRPNVALGCPRLWAEIGLLWDAADLELQHITMNLVANRRYHPNYDPYIEIRRARERLAQYKTEGDWEVDAALSEDAEKDLQRYEEKLKRRYSLRSDFTGELDLERRQLELLRRQRDIDMGKTTKKYAEYVLTIPKPERQKHHPRTPNKFRQVSRRAWDGMIRKWRKHLHNYDNPDFNETWRSLATTDVSMSSVTSNASSPSPCTEGGTMLRHPSSQAAGGDAEEAQLSSAPVIVDAWRKTQTSLELEADEDTLQGGGGGQRAPQSGAPAAPGGMSDDDTLQAADVKWNLRGRTVVAVKWDQLPLAGSNQAPPVSLSQTGSESHYAPAPDVLHSGLTNDVVGLGVRRDDSSEFSSNDIYPNGASHVTINPTASRLIKPSVVEDKAVDNHPDIVSTRES
ncbi:unnamed protein product [Mesocestoides corti]|uniref:Histone RNA hairpin-binding protein RNA-binding domain-containing protein n=1 Tax=Mesocestoides corti TaxID=53468 RepID=A0A158QST7_MESCO|nr:unnamed protein product [Mesocestoides corti]